MAPPTRTKKFLRDLELLLERFHPEQSMVGFPELYVWDGLDLVIRVGHCHYLFTDSVQLSFYPRDEWDEMLRSDWMTEAQCLKRLRREIVRRRL
jgi:hypothetical protein